MFFVARLLLLLQIRDRREGHFVADERIMAAPRRILEINGAVVASLKYLKLIGPSFIAKCTFSKFRSNCGSWELLLTAIAVYI